MMVRYTQHIYYILRYPKMTAIMILSSDSRRKGPE